MNDFFFTEVCSESFIFLYEQERQNTFQVAEVQQVFAWRGTDEVPFDEQAPPPAAGGASAIQPQGPR
jgi:hypothetical protein